MIGIEKIDYRLPQADQLLTESLLQTGFAVLSNHPISIQLIESVYGEWQDFFASDRKIEYLFDPNKQTGYFPFKTERAKDQKFADLKEFYHIYKAENIPTGMSDRSWILFNQLIELGSELLQWIENNLPQHICQDFSIPLAEMIVDSDQHLLRILHYPPLLESSSESSPESASNREDSIRAAAHEDINLITLLPGATAAGLEILNCENEWQPILSQPEDLVINVGDMLQLATKHYLKSTTHRVVNPPSRSLTESRYSMPMFLHSRSDVVLSDRHTAGSYLQERLREIGLK
jgi:isopenicillin N synthase-like dioxygenase